MRILLLVIFTAIAVSCTQVKSVNKLPKETFRGVLQVKDSVEIPFNFKVITEDTLQIFNADEVIEVTEIDYKNDSVYIKMPVFEGFLTAKIEDDNLNGNYIVPGKNRKMPFTAQENSKRFVTNKDAAVNISGDWETIFSPDDEADKYIAKGIFKQNGSRITGTFRTTTGDYRFLEGVVDGNDIKLSTFDGSHAFLFTATATDSTLTGMFYSGNHWQEPFIARKNDAFELPDAESLTFLKEGYDQVEFAFPDSEGNIVSLADKQFKNKVVLIQIMGTWCPNCLDETKFYSKFYNNTSYKDLEIVALAFEYVKNEAAAFNNIKRLKAATGVTYPILLAQYGSSSKVKANEKLPMLNHVLSYPTTIFIDKKGKVRKIHTGFNGPATGEKYTEFKTEFNDFVYELLNE